MIRALLFDLDETLLDRDALIQAFLDSCAIIVFIVIGLTQLPAGAAPAGEQSTEMQCVSPMLVDSGVLPEVYNADAFPWNGSIPRTT